LRKAEVVVVGVAHVAGLSACCGVGDGGGGNSQGDDGADAKVKKKNKTLLYPKAADSVEGMLLVSMLVKGCRVWLALS
jgi:hypothetical protein